MSLVSFSPAKPLIPSVAALEHTLSPFAEPLVRVAAGLILALLVLLEIRKGVGARRAQVAS